MLKYANRLVFRYIVALVLALSVGCISLVSLHGLFKSFDKNLDQKLIAIEHNKALIDTLTLHLEKIKADIFSLSASTRDRQKRAEIKQNIDTNALHIYDTVDKLKEKYYLEKNPHFLESRDYIENLKSTLPLLSSLLLENEQIMQILDLRDKLMQENNENLSQIAYQIRDYNEQVPIKIENIQCFLTSAKSLQNDRFEMFFEYVEEQKAFYLKIEVFVFVLGTLFLLLLVKKITKQIIELYRKMENKLYKDQLTGLHSRYYFLQDLATLKSPIVLLIDIDKFRSINELYGIEGGNEVLVKLAKILSEYAKSIGYEVCRLSADEFVLYKDATTEEDTKDLAHIVDDFYNCCNKKSIDIELFADKIDLDFTVGIAHSVNNVLQKADMALDFAKQNNLLYKKYEESIDETKSLKHNIFWKKEIKEALETDGFVPFFQPIVNREQKIIKYESLARMRRKDQMGNISFIPPFKFLGLALKTRYYNPFSKMMIMKTLLTCKEQGINVSLNIGKKDVQNLVLQKELKEKIIELGIAQNIIFEIVEVDSYIENKYLKNFVQEFREIGVKFAIDDFGSGFSNFSFILDISPEFIKIDGTLIKDIDTNKHSYELVKSIVAFSHTLGIELIAEYVHSKEVFDICYSLGIDMFQGYYFAEPKESIST
jgi:diguanylate cyclase (GGDEF)-like protein